MNKNITLEDRINKKALEMFVTDGFDSVTVNNICKEVGITKPTFYRYVSSKEEILDNYYNFDPREADPDWDRVTNGEFWPAIERGFRICYAHYLSLGPEMLSRLMIARINRNEFSFQENSEWRKTMLELIASAQSAGQIQNASSPDNVLDLMLAVSLGYCFYTCTEDSDSIGMNEFTHILKTAARVPY